MAIRSMYTGSIQVGLVNIPITLGKSYSDERENGITTICGDHKAALDRTERCSVDGKCELGNKRRAIQKGDGSWHVLEPAEFSAIEDATKSDTLKVLDVQPVDALPLAFSTGTYYVRANTKVGGSTALLSILHETLAQTGYGLVTKLCSSARQKLAIIHAHDGLVLLSCIPFLNELREPGPAERAHEEIPAPQEHVDLMVEYLEDDKVMNPEGFHHGDYTDEGLRLRQEAVEKVLGGQMPEKKRENPAPVETVNVEKLLRESLAKAKAAK